MIFVYGARLYGRTYRVPGGFHVATRFLHFMYFPLVPTSSWLVPADKKLGPDINYRLPGIIWRSVLLGWLRAVLIILAVFGGFGLLAMYLGNDSPVHITLQLAAQFVMSSVLFWGSYRLDRPNMENILESVRGSGAPEQLVKQAEAMCVGLAGPARV
jgi:hypothetical protein